jgi:hypothetical protein
MVHCSCGIPRSSSADHEECKRSNEDGYGTNADSNADPDGGGGIQAGPDAGGGGRGGGSGPVTRYARG